LVTSKDDESDDGCGDEEDLAECTRKHCGHPPPLVLDVLDVCGVNCGTQLLLGLNSGVDGSR